MILAIRTDSADAEIYLYNNGKEIDKSIWSSDRKLADELLINIQELLTRHNLGFNGLTGIVVFSGSGSFTGLRIGTTVANSISYAQDIPITDSEGDEWIQRGIIKLKGASRGKYVLPQYGAEPNITYPKRKT